MASCGTFLMPGWRLWQASVMTGGSGMAAMLAGDSSITLSWAASGMASFGADSGMVFFEASFGTTFSWADWIGLWRELWALRDWSGLWREFLVYWGRLWSWLRDYRTWDHQTRQRSRNSPSPPLLRMRRHGGDRHRLGHGNNRRGTHSSCRSSISFRWQMGSTTSQ